MTNLGDYNWLRKTSVWIWKWKWMLIFHLQCWVKIKITTDTRTDFSPVQVLAVVPCERGFGWIPCRRPCIGYMPCVPPRGCIGVFKVNNHRFASQTHLTQLSETHDELTQRSIYALRPITDALHFLNPFQTAFVCYRLSSYDIMAV